MKLSNEFTLVSLAALCLLLFSATALADPVVGQVDTFQNGDTKITHEGKMAGDAINVKSHGPWGDGEFILKHPAKK